MEHGSSSADEVDTRTTISSLAHVFKTKCYNGPDETCGGTSWPSDRDRMRFITHTDGLHPSASANIGRPRFDWNGSWWTVSSEPSIEIHRMVTPKICINRDVLPISKAFESKSIQLICFDTNTVESRDPILFYTQFRIHGGFEIEIWLSREGEIDAWITTSRFLQILDYPRLIELIQLQFGVSGGNFLLIYHPFMFNFDLD